MRRLPRIRGSAHVLPTCSASSVRTPATACLRRGLSSSSSAHDLPHLAARPTHAAWQTGHPQTQRRCLSSSASRQAQGTVIPTREASDPNEIPFPEEGDSLEVEIETDLLYPANVQVAPRTEEVTDPEYKPAERGDDLEMVGGLEGWWDNPDHWGESKQYVGFTAKDKVTDPAALEVLVKRAVVEGIVIRRFRKSDPAKTQAQVESEPAESTEDPAESADDPEVKYPKKQLRKVVMMEVVNGPDGSATLKEERDFQRTLAIMSRRTMEDPVVAAETARELAKSEFGGIYRKLKTDASWKAVQLQDPIVKFYVAKRLQRLTGHVIPDGQLLGMQSVGSIMTYLTRPPKAKKLAEEIEAKGLLSDLPNVQVFPRRVTPVDKEKMVGRWKIITRELEKRGLPVLGTGGHRKSVEKSWVTGGV